MASALATDWSHLALGAVGPLDADYEILLGGPPLRFVDGLLLRALAPDWRALRPLSDSLIASRPGHLHVYRMFTFQHIAQVLTRRDGL